ncbi:MAG TPA: hypothetical protein VFE53_19360 [Mucilaginibacter sp.]|jgi:hypothetical protein|nr:hypothetical protein [Mucilaginibacter sp.]
MKHPIKYLAGVLLLAALVYASCKKTANSPTSQHTDSYAALSSSIAVNFYQSILGKFGGINVNNGVKAPSSMVMPGRQSLFSTSLCGFVKDTAFASHSTSGDTAKTFSGILDFVFTCGSTTVNGYKVKDSVISTAIGTSFNDYDMISQNYTVVALDSTFKSVSMNGSLQSLVKNSTLTNSTVSAYKQLASVYAMAGLTVVLTPGSADVTTGVATFTTVQTNLDLSVSPNVQTLTFTGTIQFLGNHMAKLTINPNHVYSVNLITGVATPI